MGFSEMVVAIVLITSVTGLLKEWGRRRGAQRGNGDLASELKGLREEIRMLRQQNNDVVLSLDSTVDRLGERVKLLESRALPDRSSTGRNGAG